MYFLSLFSTVHVSESPFSNTIDCTFWMPHSLDHVISSLSKILKFIWTSETFSRLHKNSADKSTVENNQQSTVETIKQCMKSVKVKDKDTKKTRLTLTRLTTFVTMNRFHILFWCFRCSLWTSKYRLDDILTNKLPPVQRTQTYIRCSEDVQDVFWTSYVHPIYILCPGGNR